MLDNASKCIFGLLVIDQLYMYECAGVGGSVVIVPAAGRPQPPRIDPLVGLFMQGDSHCLVG